MKTFDIKEDSRYPCFCLACLIGKKKAEMSNYKYCHQCQANMDYDRSLACSQPKSGHITIKHDHTDSVNTEMKMSTVKGRPTTYKKRALPEDLIKQWASEGEGSKAIVTRLKSQGIAVSYKTIQRLLNGQRVSMPTS
ncbi:hypothetical protein ACFLW8_02620 [Chloroflexota bacterium]